MTPTLLLRSLALALPLVLPLAVAAPASAGSWSTILSVGEARSQACKVPTTDGRGWKLRVRLVNREDQQFRATYSVTAGERVVRRVVLLAPAGRTSAVRTLVIRRGGTQRLGASLGSSDGALGDSNVLRGVGRC